MHSLNAPCMGYVVQTSAIKWMVRSFARMYHSQKSVQRNNRTFLYLPVVSRLMSDAEFERNVREVFHTTEMDLMPDLDIVKVVKEMCSHSTPFTITLKGKSLFITILMCPNFFREMSVFTALSAVGTATDMTGRTNKTLSNLVTILFLWTKLEL